MKNLYKYVLVIFILAATVFLTIQHYSDPIYKFKLGRTLNMEDKKIEDWGGRFPETETLYMGFRTRLDTDEIVTIEIKTSTGEEVTEYNFTVIEDSDFYYVIITPGSLGPEDYMAYIVVEDEVLESMRFALDEIEE